MKLFFFALLLGINLFIGSLSYASYVGPIVRIHSSATDLDQRLLIEETKRLKKFLTSNVGLKPSPYSKNNLGIKNSLLKMLLNTGKIKFEEPTSNMAKAPDDEEEVGLLTGSSVKTVATVSSLQSGGYLPWLNFVYDYFSKQDSGGNELASESGRHLAMTSRTGSFYRRKIVVSIQLLNAIKTLGLPLPSLERLIVPSELESIVDEMYGLETIKPSSVTDKTKTLPKKTNAQQLRQG